MKVYLPLLLLIVCCTVHAQSLATEDSLLRQRYDQKEISLDRYRSLAEKLRDATEEAGGYPDMPVDTLGRYRLITVIDTDLTVEQLSRVIARWLALGGFAGVNHYAYDGDDGMVRYVATPYVFSGQRRELFTGLHALADRSTVGCVMEVAFGEGRLVVSWSDPLLLERYSDLTMDAESAAASARERPLQIADLLPVVDKNTKWYSWNLVRAKLLHDCVSGLAESLRKFVQSDRSHTYD